MMIKKSYRANWYVTVFLFFLYGYQNIVAEDIVAVSLNGTYDFDGDGLSEFLSIEKPDPIKKYPQTVTYYEIDDNTGIHTQIWSFIFPSPVIDARIVDMDGNDVPEVIVLTSSRASFADQNNPWLYLFPWETISFTPVAISSWSGEKAGGNKPFGFTALDMDNDRRDEIAIAVGSPGREIILLQLNSALELPTIEISRRLPSLSLSSGYGQIFVSTVDHNRDGFSDLMAISKEFSALKVQLFTNEGGDLVEGPFFRKDLSQWTQDLSGLISCGINTVDINQDGVDEVLLPFQAGHAVALNMDESGSLTFTPVDIEVASLFSFPEGGFDFTAINDILLERTELGLTGKKVVSKLELESVEAQPLEEPEEVTAVEAEPEPATPVKRVRLLELTTVEAAPEDTAAIPPVTEGVADSAITAVDREPPLLDVEVVTVRESATEEVAPPAEPESVGIAPSEAETVEEELPEAEDQPRKVRQLQLTTLDKGEEETVPPEDTTSIKRPLVFPEEIEIADTALVGEKYIHSIEESEERRLRAFTHRMLPLGAFYDPTDHVVTWTPTENQIGVHKLAYEVEYEISGEDVKVQEVEGVGVQVLTTTETDTVDFYILVRRTEEP